VLVELGAQNLYSVLAILVYAAEIQQIIIIIENMRISQLLLEIYILPHVLHQQICLLFVNCSYHYHQSESTISSMFTDIKLL